MFVTKRIHPGAFPMNGKFTQLLFLKTAKSKKRKTCRNIFFFRTMHTTFPTYICICWPWLALAGADWLRLLLPASASACSGMLLPLPAPACSGLLLPLPAPACPENKSGLECAQHARNALPRHKTRQKRAHQHKKSLTGTKPGRNVPTRHHLGTKKTENVPSRQKKSLQGTKPGRNVPTRHHLGTKKTENVPG